MNYGDKRDFPKIDIFVGSAGSWQYRASTSWSKTCREAKARFFAAHQGVHIDNIKCLFNRKG
jgi:hypothetical protein